MAKKKSSASRSQPTPKTAKASAKAGKQPSRTTGTNSKTVALVYRTHTEQAARTAADVVKWLNEQGHRVFTAPAQDPLAGAPALASFALVDVDLVVVLGGDGTYLRAVRMLDGRQIPILGFNMGSLGFLTIHSSRRWRELLTKTLDGKMELRSRTMIHTIIRRASRVRGEFFALNDVVLERGSYSHLINAAIFLGDHKISEVKADAFIVSSPTGSTAYNLAAGGPILDPETPAIAITPVAPHALTTRPIVVPDTVEIHFRLVPGRDQKVHFIVDGQKQLEISNEDEVTLKKAKSAHLTVREPGFNFYTLLKEKLKFGDRA